MLKHFSEEKIVVSKARLQGEVVLSGAKNSALRLVAASILTPDTLHLVNAPAYILDIGIQLEMLAFLGKEYKINGQDIIITEAAGLSGDLNWSKRSIRNTLLVLGALTARVGYGRVPLPGGCKIGERKYDFHIMLLEKLGARVWEEEGYLCAEAKNGLTGADIHLPGRSTGATENSILCGTMAKGTTTIWNPHIRPEILDLIDMLNKMGADIKVVGQLCIIVNGTGGAPLKGTTHEVIPDNMEALTWAIASVITNGDIEIKNFPFSHLEVPLIFLRESGMNFYRGETSLIVRGGRPLPFEISTGPFPGINSDMQPLFGVYGALSGGECRIVDLRFPGRFGYAYELGKMGMKFSENHEILVINGGTALHGATVEALDLRAGMALLLAGLASEGETTITNAWQISRGYEHLDKKLNALIH